MSAQGDKVATDPGQIGIAIRALNMSRHSGDQASVWRQGDILLAVIVDGLGHGPEAEAAARTAVTYIDEHFEDPLANLLTGCDHALRESRGAAMSLARLDMANRVLSFTAIGNTREKLLSF